jgi:DNA helicase INO80
MPTTDHQTFSSPPPRHSPNTPSHHIIPHPSRTELPPISTALYSPPARHYDDRAGVGRYYPPQGPPHTGPLQVASPYDKPFHSPVASNFAHQSPLQRPPSQGLAMEPVSPYRSLHRGAVQPPPIDYMRRPSRDEVSEGELHQQTIY